MPVQDTRFHSQVMIIR